MTLECSCPLQINWKFASGYTDSLWQRDSAALGILKVRKPLNQWVFLSPHSRLGSQN